MKLTTTPFSESDTPAETVRKLNAMFRQLQERLDVDSVRVGNTTKLNHNGDATFADVTAEDVTCKDVTCKDVVCEDVTAEDVTCADITGEDATFDSLDMDGTETDELIDVDRVIDATVTKDAVTVTEARSGTIAADEHAGFAYTGTVDGTSFATHYGFSSTIDHDSGTLVLSSPYFAKLDSEGTFLAPQLYGGVMALDGESSPSPLTVMAGLGLTVKGKSTSRIYGAYTLGTNDHTGEAVGYRGYGKNTGTAADTGVGNACGLWGYVYSAEGLGIGVRGESLFKNARTFAFVGVGHNHFSDGVTYIHTSDAVATATNKTHIAETDDGSLWVENKIEVVEAAYFDDDVVIDKELKGGRCLLTATHSSSNTVSRYLTMAGGITMNANRGYPMARAGSIVGVEGQAKVVASTGGATCYIDVYINGVLEASTDLLDCDSYIGELREWGETEPRGQIPFVAHDVLAFYLRIVGSATIQYPVGVAELQFDT
jgi:hypothetical protein